MDKEVKLYRMLQRNLKTGNDIVLYGHATENVISQFWQAYVGDDYVVIIQEYKGQR